MNDDDDAVRFAFVHLYYHAFTIESEKRCDYCIGSGSAPQKERDSAVMQAEPLSGASYPG